VRLRKALISMWLAVWVVGCSSPATIPSPSPTASASQPTSPVGSDSASPAGDGRIGLSLADATAIARANISIPAAELRSHAPGNYESVVQTLFGPGTPAEDLPDPYSQDALVWGLFFVTPDSVATVYVDLLAGLPLYIEESGRPDQLPEPHRSDIVFEPPILQLSNGTTLPVQLMVNDESAGEYAPEGQAAVDLREFGEAPWTVVAKTESGRDLLSIPAITESRSFHTVGDYPHSGSSVGGRLFLSCGQLTMFIGTAPSGPAPGPSYPPHDCDQ
jgi:hypothetical protein